MYYKDCGNLCMKDELRQKLYYGLDQDLMQRFDNVINMVLNMTDGSLSDPKVIKRIDKEFKRFKVVYLIDNSDEIIDAYWKAGDTKDVTKDAMIHINYYNNNNFYPVQIKECVIEDCGYYKSTDRLLYKIVKRKEETL